MFNHYSVSHSLVMTSTIHEIVLYHFKSTKPRNLEGDVDRGRGRDDPVRASQKDRWRYVWGNQ